MSGNLTGGLEKVGGMSPVTLSEDWSRVARLLVVVCLSVVGSVGNVYMVSAIMIEDHLKKRDRPSAPGKPQLVPADRHSAEPDVVTIRWDLPVYDGGSHITGYLVEHRRTGSPHWVRSSPSLVRLPELTLSGLEPGWRYQFRVSAQNSAGLSDPGELSDLLTVTLHRTVASSPFFVQELKDITALENDKAELSVVVRGTPAPIVSWFKDGVELFSSRSYRVVTDEGTSTLVIHQAALADEGEIKCSATNRVGYAVTRCKLTLEAPPSIRLPRQYEEGLLFEKDEVIRLKVAVAGRPVPEVAWQLNGEPIGSGKGGRFEVSHSERYATLRVGEARRGDRGEYHVRAVNKLGEDSASFLVTVADRPMAPGRAKVVMALGRSVTLSWATPEDDGGCKIGNYIVEYYRLGWNMWLKAATCRQLTTTLGDLIEGSEYKFRVKAENPYGVSDPSHESDVVFIPDPKRGLLQPPEHGTDDIEESMDHWLTDKKRAMSVSPTVDHRYGERKTKKRRGPPIPTQLLESPMERVDKHSFLSEDSMSPPATPEDICPEIPKRRGKSRPEKEDYVKATTNIIQREKSILDKKELTSSKKDKIDLREYQEEEEMQLARILDEKRKLQELKRFELRKSDEITRAEGPIVEKINIKEEKLSKEQVRKKKEALISKLPQSPRVKGDHIHGSSEFMLVLLPNSEGPIEEKETSKREMFESSMALEGDVAPPMSLSAPELGNGEPLELPPLRSAYSSTELLHERAMARFYQDMAEEEVESIRRRTSLQRRRSFGSRNRVGGSLQELWPLSEKVDLTTTIGKAENSLFVQKSLEYSLLKVTTEKAFSRDSMESVLSAEEPHRKPPLVQQPSEEDREYEDSSFDEDEDDYDEEEEDDDESHADYLLDGEMEVDEDDELSGEGKRESLYTSESDDDSRCSYSISGYKLQNDQNKMNYSDDTLISAYERRGPVIVQPQQEEPLPGPKHELSTGVKLNPILKRFQTDLDTSAEKNNDSSECIIVNENDTNRSLQILQKRYEPNFSAAKPKPILKSRERSQESLASKDPLNEPESNLISSSRTNIDEGSDYEVGVKKKQVRIEEPIDIAAKVSSMTDNNKFNSDLEKAGNTSVGSDDTPHVLINHYSDIVKEYGGMKKPSKPLYLDYDALKAAAEKEEQYGRQIPTIVVDGPSTNCDNYKEEEQLLEINKNDKTQLERNLLQESISLNTPESTDKKYSSKESELRRKPKHIVPKKCKKRSPSPMFRNSHKILNANEENHLDQHHTKKLEHSPKSSTTDLPLRHLTLAEQKVHSYLDFLMDFSLFIMACWLYLFKDERLAIPVLFLMIYRQAHQAFQTKMEALRNRIPRRLLFWKGH